MLGAILISPIIDKRKELEKTVKKEIIFEHDKN